MYFVYIGVYLSPIHLAQSRNKVIFIQVRVLITNPILTFQSNAMKGNIRTNASRVMYGHFTCVIHVQCREQ